MKKSIVKIVVAGSMLLSVTVNNAQIKNAKTTTVKVYGNCGMCEKTIEKTGSIKKIAAVDWNQTTQLASLTYDTKKTNPEEILKRIALAGYDSDEFLAPDDVYNNLHGCCQYDRTAKVPVKGNMSSVSNTSEKETTNNSEVKENQLNAVFDNYFGIKDALVKNDGAAASTEATELLSSINAVKMETLEMDVHMVWMKVLSTLKSDAEIISKTKEVAKQRKQLISLSNTIYKLLKISKTESPTYYQFCPMANDGKGAHWLSKENIVKNPYYGSKMLNCGKTVETIK